MDLHIGDTVRLLKGRTRQEAKVVSYVPNVEGGVWLDTRLDGFRAWNQDALVLVPKRNRTTTTEAA